MKQVFDPTQETLEEYLRRINSDGPWSESRDVLYLNHGQKGKRRWKTKTLTLGNDAAIYPTNWIYEINLFKIW